MNENVQYKSGGPNYLWYEDVVRCFGSDRVHGQPNSGTQGSYQKYAKGDPKILRHTRIIP